LFGVCVETTQRVRRDQDQIATAKRERDQIFEMSRDLMAVATFDGYLKSINPAWSRQLGRSEQDLLAKPFAEIIHPDDLALTSQVVATLQAGQPVHQFRVRLLTAQGTAMAFAWSAAPDAAPGGTTFYMVGRDISQDADALRQSEARLRLLDNLGKAVIKLDDADQILAVTTRMVGEHMGISNCAYADMDDDQDGFTIRGDWAAPGSPSIVGHYRLADFGKLAVDNLSAGLPLIVNDNLAELAPHEAATFQAIGIAATICMPLVKDGCLKALMAIHDKVPRAWSKAELALIREVTDRSWAHIERVGAQAELRATARALAQLNATLEQRVAERTAALEQSTKAVRTVFDTSHLNQGLLTPEGRIIHMNRTALDTIRARFEDLVGKVYWDTPWFTATPGAPEAIRAAVTKVAAGQSATVALALDMPTGHRTWDFSMRPVLDDAGQVVALVSEAVEITARLRAEEALRQAQKMEAIGQLTGGIAHDFNNLLAGISGSLELLEKRVATGQIDTVQRYIDTARTSAQRAAALTQRLLAFSRRQTLDPRATDINRLTQEMDDLIRRTMGPTILVEMNAASDLWLTRVDRAQLESAVLNLALNARDAMPDGGRLIIETANAVLDNQGSTDNFLSSGDFIALCVTDTGTGMTPEVVSRAFDPFYTTKPIGQGTGLGLSMIHGFTRQSGGTVRIESKMGRGTTMRLYFPRYYGVLEEPQVAPDVTPVPAAAGETVLIIDDEETVRMLAAETLAAAGYRVLQAAQGGDGLKILQSAVAVDLLVTDVGLAGGINGRQVADAARISRPGLKVLFITGYAEHAVISDGVLEPGMRVITKPFALADLASKVRAMIDEG
jgi:PAS domain S-box-containing protein